MFQCKAKSMFLQLARIQRTRHVIKQVLQGDVLASFPTLAGTLKLFHRQNN